MNSLFHNSVVEKIKLVSFHDEKKNKKINVPKTYVTNTKFNNKIFNVKKEKIKKSLIKLTKVFRQK